MFFIIVLEYLFINTEKEYAETAVSHRLTTHLEESARKPVTSI
jgi:hypothetical protein